MMMMTINRDQRFEAELIQSINREDEKI